MKLPIMLAMCSALIGVVALSSTAIAQQKKTKAECTKEWQANKAENQANKITEKAYVDKCIKTAATPAAATAPAAPAAPAKPAAVAPAKPAAPVPAVTETKQA